MIGSMAAANNDALVNELNTYDKQHNVTTILILPFSLFGINERLLIVYTIPTPKLMVFTIKLDMANMCNNLHRFIFIYVIGSLDKRSAVLSTL